MAKATENDWKNRYNSLVGGRYGAEPNYKSEPGAGDEINQEPESPSNRRWRRERTPDLPIPRRRRDNDDGCLFNQIRLMRFLFRSTFRPKA